MDLTAWAALAGVATVVLLLAGLIYKAGKFEERVTSKIVDAQGDIAAISTQITTLEAKRIETLRVVEQHIQESGIHIVPQFEARIYAEQAEWRRSLQGKVDEMYRMLLLSKRES